MAFSRNYVEIILLRSVFLLLDCLLDTSVMPNAIALSFLPFIIHLDILFLILPVIYRFKLPNNVSQNQKSQKF